MGAEPPECGNVEMGPQGISLHVENGPMTESDTLIGADGVHSLLRRSFIPNSNLNVLPYVMFNGRRSVTLEDISMNSSHIWQARR